jgi:hypothetical protein
VIAHDCRIRPYALRIWHAEARVSVAATAPYACVYCDEVVRHSHPVLVQLCVDVDLCTHTHIAHTCAQTYKLAAQPRHTAVCGQLVQ